QWGPAERRLAQERGIDLAQIQGTGPGSRILLEDVQKALEARTPAAPAPPAPAEVAVQVTPAARHLARQHGVDLRRVQGTGPRGRILLEDVQKALKPQAQPTANRHRSCPSGGCVRPLPRVWCRACRLWPRSPSPPRWT